MGFAFASVGFHKGALLIFKGGQSQKVARRCSNGIGIWQKQEVYSWTLGPSDTSFTGRRLQSDETNGHFQL